MQQLNFNLDLYNFDTRMHSSGMRTAHSLTYREVFLTETLDREPPGQRPPCTELAQYRNPWTETHPLDRDLPWTEPPEQRSPPVDRQTRVKTLRLQTLFAGGENQ